MEVLSRETKRSAPMLMAGTCDGGSLLFLIVSVFSVKWEAKSAKKSEVLRLRVGENLNPGPETSSVFPVGAEYPLFFYRCLLLDLHVFIIVVGYFPYATDRKMEVLRLTQSLYPYYFLVLF